MYLGSTTGHRLTIFSDNGKEFLNKKLTDFFTQEGILHERTIPHTPQQNGKAKRKVCTLVENSSTVLGVSTLPQSLCLEVFWRTAKCLNFRQHPLTVTIFRK
eukprot:TRINITY_DN5408_c0_g3_i2.p2 TRINITY_DN5408_c0_g3~~TRINITY_DN5408_c0_g3_i2.p2  ORF type:complete len:102 (+),score=10.50 TRINITY_DN5408_c0_g3_i2:538-843(+)